MGLGLLIALVLLVGINLLIAAHQLTKHDLHSPTIESLKDISMVYDVLDKLVDETKAYKVAISKACYKCDEPWAEMIYDNHVEGEERYNEKYTRIPIDQQVVDELKIVANGRHVAVNIEDLPDGLKKTLYSQEGIVYSETHKIIEVGEHLYVLVMHYRVPADKIGDDMDYIDMAKSDLHYIFVKHEVGL